MRLVPRLVLTLVGDDRPGIVNALAGIVTAHDGNWETSQLAQLAGAFAGIAVMEVPADQVEALTGALQQVTGLEIAVHRGSDEPAPARRLLTLNVLGNDRPGIVRDVSAVLRRHGLSIESLSTETRDTPLTGGRLFEARTVAAVPAATDLTALRADLEELASEILVDIDLADA
jgi:glycine cleavage system regulatory protein